MTLPEVLLWQQLRGRAGAAKFRRQHPVAGFVADFYCAASRLIIEVDGEAHNRGGRPERDIARDERLRQLGYHVLRIPAAEILTDAGAAADAIVRAASPLHHSPAASGPPPHAARREDQSANGQGAA
jgi:very-short-patch-repair endonuclease